MALLKIARMGHEMLLRRADPVGDPTAPAIQRLIADMIETMEDAGGVGLAAPQVHVALRLFVFSVPEQRAEGGADPPRPVACLINPTLTPLDDEIAVRQEGCLSIPGLAGAVPRHRRVRFEGWDENGAAVSGDAEGFLAVVLQHEYDHLDGILYPMRMTDLSRLGFTDELSRSAARAPA